VPDHPSEPQLSEKEFYLRSFRHRSMLISFDERSSVSRCLSTIEELVDNPTLVVVLAPGFPRGTVVHKLRARDAERGGASLAAMGAMLMSEGVAFVRRPSHPAIARELAYCRRLATMLRADKLVVCTARGGLPMRRRTRSFVTTTGLSRMLSSNGNLGPWTPAALAELVETVGSGIESVNLTTPEGLAAELFTYQGSGTLLTSRQYCTVERLGVDDFHEALQLLRRGEREGFLLTRTDEEKIELMLSGYGAWFEQNRLAGVAALETKAYRRQRVGEVRGLYTITRFKGEGVGARILAHLAMVASEAKLRGLFACTSNRRAAAFFARHGFKQVDKSAVPQQKWVDRKGPPDPAVFWRDL